MDIWVFIPIIPWIIGCLSIVYYGLLQIRSQSHEIVIQKPTLIINKMICADAACGGLTQHQNYLNKYKIIIDFYVLGTTQLDLIHNR